MNAHQPLDQLWESYIFTLSTLVIDSVSPCDQTKLINLINKPGQSSQEDTSLSKQGYPGSGSLTASPVAQLERQWGAALKKPLSPQRIRIEGNKVVLQRSFSLNQQQIQSTQACIDRLDDLIERAQKTLLNGPSQHQLLLHYQGIQGKYLVYLGELKAVQAKP